MLMSQRVRQSSQYRRGWCRPNGRSGWTWVVIAMHRSGSEDLGIGEGSALSGDLTALLWYDIKVHNHRLSTISRVADVEYTFLFRLL